MVILYGLFLFVHHRYSLLKPSGVLLEGNRIFWLPAFVVAGDIVASQYVRRNHFEELFSSYFLWLVAAPCLFGSIFAALLLADK